MTEIIPAIIPQDLNMVKEKLEKVLHLTKKVQIDILDGRYTPSNSWPFKDNQFDEFIQIVRGEENFPYFDQFYIEIDMLVLHPIEYLSDFISIGAKSFVFHIDSTDHLEECIKTAKNASCSVGVGIKPSLDFSLLDNFISKIDFVQFMGSDKVGYNGVELDEKLFEKIIKFNSKNSSVLTQVDIGVNENTIPKLKEVGVSRFVSSSSIFDTPHPKEAFLKLRSL